MKPIFLFFTFLILSFTSFSQARIGFNSYVIKSDFYFWTFQSDYTNDGTNTYYIYTNTPERGMWAYYFNSEGICFLCKFFPNTQGDLNYYVENFNNKYVIVSDTEWKMYNNNGIMNIKLQFENGLSYFVFY